MSSAFHGDNDGLAALRSRLVALREKLIDWEDKLGRSGMRFEGTSEPSARNLIHYLALRSEDVRPLQRVLRAYGLSSLGRTESHVLASVEAVIALLDRMGGVEETGMSSGTGRAGARGGRGGDGGGEEGDGGEGTKREVGRRAKGANGARVSGELAGTGRRGLADRGKRRVEAIQAAVGGEVEAEDGEPAALTLPGSVAGEVVGDVQSTEARPSLRDDEKIGAADEGKAGTPGTFRPAARDGGDGEIAARLVAADEGRAILDERAEVLFGVRPEGRRVRIMVTAPDEAAEDYGLVRDLLVSGMNCLRINCAYGDENVWRAMIEHVRRAESELGKPCRVLMDLSGPRARTGPLEPGPTVLKVRPVKDESGWVTQPAEVWLAESVVGRPPEGLDAVLQLPRSFLRRLGPGDRLSFRDARGARRRLTVVDRLDGGVRARLEKTAYFANGTRVWHRPPGVRAKPRSARIGGIPPIEQRIVLHEGDRLILTRDQRPGRPAVIEDGRIVAPARIPCTPPEVLADLRVGEPIWFDEGRIGGRIVSAAEDEVVVSITSAPPVGGKLGAYKGINLPESDLRLPALTAHDKETLPFIAEHADLVGYSFIRTAADLRELYHALDALPGRKPGVILKIETLDAFQNLPAILFEALCRPAVGVMIARGDLAVECGFERLAEVQEEILWLCEAAHLPVVWATQVLEGLAKRGLASRAEITDAAFGERAECVMLNKGPFIVETVRSLDEILQRMQEHQEKKVSLLRHLRVADDFLDSLAERAGTASASPS